MLLPKQIKCLDLLFSGCCVTDVCKKLNIGRATFYRWKKLPEFKDAIFERHRELNQDHNITLLFLTGLALDKLAVMVKQGDFRAICFEENGVSWFDAAEICKAIGLKNTVQALERLDDDEKRLVSKEDQKGISQTYIPVGGFQDKWFINESGLYHLVLQCELPKAKPFRKWVTDGIDQQTPSLTNLNFLKHCTINFSHFKKYFLQLCNYSVILNVTNVLYGKQT